MFSTRLMAVIVPLTLTLIPLSHVFAQQHDATRSPVHRSRTATGNGAPDEGSQASKASQKKGRQHGGGAIFPLEFRSIDGYGNNLKHPERGAADVPFVRMIKAAYANGTAAPAGQDRPSARTISNKISAQTTDLQNNVLATDFLWQWGQFVDHDIDETPIGSPAEAFDIAVPLGDVWFDPQSTGTMSIPLDRSAWELKKSVRQQVNGITAFIDASNVYGSDLERAAALRTLDGTGRLATSAGNMLPYNLAGLSNAPAPTADYFLAGDIRANEQVALTAMHTVFVREHNFWATEMARHLALDGDTLYEAARALVAAEIQVITYRDFLPALLGEGAPRPYRGYRTSVDPGISNIFAAAAFRMGHTLLSPQLLRLEADGSQPDGPLELKAAFFSPSTFLATGPAPLLRGLAAQACQDLDPFIIDDVRNFLFGPPGSGGFDLAALNIQRGRDHGLPSYAAVRARLKLGKLKNFGQITSDATRAQLLEDTYSSVKDIDAWVGMLAEDHVPGALVGPTLRKILGDQFERLRDGDRFWYQAYLPPELAQFVESQSLTTIIRRNTDIGDELSPDVFRITP